MSKKRRTRRALINSVISLIICFSMLLGTTFAWFTDSVSSDVNKIVAGNLDVELQYFNDQNQLESAEGKEDILFNDISWWEPGVVAFENIVVRNAGDLAFMYQLSMNYDNETIVDGHSLAEVLKIAVVEENVPLSGNTAAERTKLVNELTQNGEWKSLNVAASEKFATGKLLPENSTLTEPADAVIGSKMYGIVVYWEPGSSDNDYNLNNERRDMGPLSIDLGVSLIATQLEAEFDSFGNDYDEDAKYEEDIVQKKVVEFAGVEYYSLQEAIDAAAVSGNAATVTLISSLDVAESVVIPENADITIDGDGYAVTRNDGYTGTIINVLNGSLLTIKDITVDGGAEWSGDVDATLQRGTTNRGTTATGNLIATSGTGSIVLNEGTVLENNAGAHAISLATRGGGSLTINGAQVINNSSDSGAIWGGGNIIVNAGSEISGNSSTGLAGVIRMVSSCNFTMNGGEISHNKAVTDGGVIWGYGSSVYTFTGGEIAYNEAGGTGGAIYTGTYSKIEIGGDFELHDNKASNSGAIRLTDHTSMNMTGGKVYNNTQNGVSNAFNTWNNAISITGGEILDDFSFVGGLGLTIGAADIDGVVSYNLSTNHNTAYLAADFSGFKFEVNEAGEHFTNFNFKPADGYTYTEGDENKLVCLNDGYSVYWDTSTSTFRLIK